MGINRGLSIGGGIAKGIMNVQMMNLKKQMMQAEQDYKDKTLKQQEKYQTDLLKMKQEEARTKQMWVDMFQKGMEGDPPRTPSGASMAPSFMDENGQLSSTGPPDMGQGSNSPAQGLVDEMAAARASMSSPASGSSFAKKMTPQMMIAAKGAGMDITGIMNYMQRGDHNKIIEDQGDERNRIARQNALRRENTVNYQTVTNPDGSTSSVPMSYAGIPAGAQPAPGGPVQPVAPQAPPAPPGMNKPPTLTKTLSPKAKASVTPATDVNRPFYVNPDTFKRAPTGKSPGELEKLGFVKIPAGQMEKVQKLEMAKDIIEETRTVLEEHIPRDEKGVIGRAKAVGRSIEAATQFTERGEDLAVWKDYINGTRAMLAKALGEVGNLSESEQMAVMSLYGSLMDTGSKMWKQYDKLVKTFDNAKELSFGRMLAEDISIPGEISKPSLELPGGGKKKVKTAEDYLKKIGKKK